MKFSIKQSILLEHLNVVIRGISNKNLIPILNCIKFELTKKGLFLLSTDNELAVKSFIANEFIEDVKETGEIVIYGHYIYDIIRKLPNTTITFEELIDSKINVYTETSSFNLNCNSVSEFPNLELEDSKTPIVISKKIFKNIINNTVFASSTQESRPVLTGINFKLDKNTLCCVATDSYRLAKKVINLEAEYKEKYNIIIPTKSLNEIIKILDDDKNIEIHIFNNKVIFKFNDIIIMSRIINGTYPDITSLIPKEYQVIIKAKKNELYNAIDRASLLSDNEKNTIKVETKKETMIISSNIPEIGNVEEKLIIQKNNKEEIKISFSSKYMLDALKNLDSEEVCIMFNGEIKPIIIKNDEGEESLQLIVPIRTY